MNDRLRFRLKVVGTLLSLVIAVSAALGMRGRVRLVDIVALFAGGMGTGVTVALLARELRDRSLQKTLAD